MSPLFDNPCHMTIGPIKEATSRAAREPHIARARGVRKIFFAPKQNATMAFAIIKPTNQPSEVQSSLMIVPVKKNIKGDTKVASQTACFSLRTLP